VSALVDLFRLARPHLGWIALSILISVAATLANIALMATSGWFITAMGLAGVAGATLNYFTPAAIIRATAIIRTGGRYLDRLISHEATFRLLASLRVRLFAGLIPRVPVREGDWRSGDLAGRLSGEINRLELMFLRVVAPMVVAVLTAATVLAVLAWVSPPVAGVAGTFLGLAGVVLPMAAIAMGQHHGIAASDWGAALRRGLADEFDGLAARQMSGTERQARNRLVGEMEAMLAAEARLARIGALGQAASGLMQDLAGVALLMIAIPLVGAGTLSGPDLTMILLAATATFEALGGLPEALASLGGALKSARRVFELAAPRTPDVTGAATPSGRFDITLRGVGLIYAGRDRAALRDVSLDIPEGQHVALVGESGAGKSSLVNLLTRLDSPTAGTILLGGVDIGQMSPAAVRALIVAVPQAAYLLSTSIGENLRLGKPEATEAELHRALDMAGFRPVLERMPEGLGTHIGTAGAKLSGGEARRLAIARALILDPPVLILDEPGEGLDPETERTLLSGLLAARAGRTTLVITHHEIGLARMDRVINLPAAAG
jgi:ATP-binding cassette subfamily C protein CydC